MRLKIHVWLTLLAVVFSLQAQTNVPVRPISLKQAVQLALENNFEIAIGRYEPQLRAYELGGDYGYYDPQFSVTALHTFETAEGEFDPRTGIQSPAGTGREEDLLDFDLDGILWPTGLRYSLGADYQHRTGTTERNIITIDPYDNPQNTTIRGFVPFDQYATDFSIALEQPLLRDFWIDGGRLLIKLSRKDVRISEYALLFTVQDTVRQVEQAYYRLTAAREFVESWQKFVDLGQSLLGEIRSRIEAGQLATLEDKQVESEIALRQTELSEYQEMLIREENLLKDLISNQAQQWHNVRLVPAEKLLAVPQRYDLQESWISGLNSRPDFHQLKEELERQGLVVKYTFNQLFPYLSLVGTYGRRGFDELVYRENVQTNVMIGNTTNDITTLVRSRDSSYTRALRDVGSEVNPRYSWGAVLRFPLSFRQERHNHKLSKATEQQLTARLQEMQQEIMIDIDTSIQVAKLIFDRVQTARRGRELAEAALDAEMQKLNNNRSNPFSVVRMQRDLIDLREKEIEALRDYNVELAELQFREGKTLEKKGVSVQISNK